MNQEITNYEICKKDIIQDNIHCKNPKITFAEKEGVTINCRDCDCIKIQSIPGATKKCIYVTVDCREDCGACGEKTFEYCFCDNDKDCGLCGSCHPIAKVCVPKVCPPTPNCPNPYCDPLTGACVCCTSDAECPCNQICTAGGCGCPPNAPYPRPGSPCCDQCNPEHPCENPCDTCVDGKCLPKCGTLLCNPLDPNGRCVECISSGDCKKPNECCDPVTGKCVCCPGYIRNPVTGNCVPKPPCTTDAECGACERCNAQNNCEPIKCPANQTVVLVAGKPTCVPECDCATKQGCSDPTKACQPSCTDPGTCGCKPCEGSCPNGCKDPCFCNQVTVRCEANPCVGSCNNGADCGPGCGCDPVTKRCVPCAAIPCNTCSTVLGCFCPTGGSCGKVTDCPPTSCSHYSECGPGCTCYKGKCVSCRNFSCTTNACADQPGCGCNAQGTCEGIQEACTDVVELEKVDSNCDLIGRLYKDNCCPCPELTAGIKGRIAQDTATAVIMDFSAILYKGAFDGISLDSKPQVDAFNHPNIAENEPPVGGQIGAVLVTTYGVYRIEANGELSRIGSSDITTPFSAAYAGGGTASVNFNNVNIPKIDNRETLDINTIRIVERNVIGFTITSPINFPNDCSYPAGTPIARYVFTTNTDFSNFSASLGNGKGTTISAPQCRKALVKWTKSEDSTINEAPFRKLYIPGVPVGSQTLYEDILRDFVNDELEGCFYYHLDFDCNCAGDQTKYIVFCNPPNVEYDVTKCNRCVTLKGPFNPCDVNLHKEYYVQFGTNEFKWIGAAIPAGEERCSTDGFDKITFGLTCDVLNECTKEYPIEAQELEVTGTPQQAACTAGQTELTFEVTGGTPNYNWSLFNQTTAALLQSGVSAESTIKVVVALTAETNFKFHVIDAGGCEGETNTNVKITLDGTATITAEPPCPGVTNISGSVLWTPQSVPYAVQITKGSVTVSQQSGLTENTASFTDASYVSGDTYKAVITDAKGCIIQGELKVDAKTQCGDCTISANATPVCANELPGAMTMITGTISGSQGTPAWVIKDAGGNTVAQNEGVQINVSVPVTTVGQKFTITSTDSLGLTCPPREVTVGEKPSEQCNVAGCPSCPPNTTNPVAITITGSCGGGANQVGEVTLTTNITDGTSYRWSTINGAALIEMGVTTTNAFTYNAAIGPRRIKVIIEGSNCGSNLEAYSFVNGVPSCNDCPCDVAPGDQDVNLTVNTGNPAYNGFGCLPKVCKSNLKFPIVVSPQLSSSCAPTRFWWRRVLPTYVETFTNVGVAPLTIQESQVTTPGIYLFEYHHELPNNCHAPIFYGFEVIADGTGACGSSVQCHINSVDINISPATRCVGSSYDAVVVFSGTGTPSGVYTANFELFRTDASGNNPVSLGNKSESVSGTGKASTFKITPQNADTIYLKAKVTIEGCNTAESIPTEVTVLPTTSPTCITCKDVVLPNILFQHLNGGTWLLNRSECANEPFTAVFKATGAVDPTWIIERSFNGGSYVNVTGQATIPNPNKLQVNLPQTLTNPGTYRYRATISNFKDAQGNLYTCQQRDTRAITVTDCSCGETAVPTLNLPATLCAGQTINLYNLTSGGYGVGSYDYGVGSCVSGVHSANRIANPAAYVMPSSTTTIVVQSRDASTKGCPTVCNTDTITLKTVGCTTCTCVGGGQSFNFNVGPPIASVTMASGQSLAGLGSFNFPYSNYAALENAMEAYLQTVCANPQVDIKWATNNQGLGVFSMKVQGVPSAPQQYIPTSIAVGTTQVPLTAAGCNCTAPTLSAGALSCESDGFFYLPVISGTSPVTLTCSSSPGTCVQQGNGVRVTGPTSGQVALTVYGSNKCGLATLSAQLDLTAQNCEDLEYTLGSPFCAANKYYVPVIISAGQIQSSTCGAGISGTSCQVLNNPTGYTGTFAVYSLGCSVMAQQVLTTGLVLSVTLNGEIKTKTVTQQDAFDCCNICQGTPTITPGTGSSCTISGAGVTTSSPVLKVAAGSSRGFIESPAVLTWNDSCEGNKSANLTIVHQVTSSELFSVGSGTIPVVSGDRINELLVRMYNNGAISSHTLDLSGAVFGGSLATWASAVLAEIESEISAAVPGSSNGTDYDITVSNGADGISIVVRNSHVAGTSQRWIAADFDDFYLHWSAAGGEAGVSKGYLFSTGTPTLQTFSYPTSYKCSTITVAKNTTTSGTATGITKVSFYQLSLNSTTYLSTINTPSYLTKTISPSTCNAAALSLSVSGATCSNPTYIWTASSGGMVVGPSTGSSIQTNGTGTYQVIVLCGDGCGYVKTYTY